MADFITTTCGFRFSVHTTDLECLDHILSRGPVTAGALAEMTGLTTGAITGVIDRLERAGLARRGQDANDRRKVLVRALPAVQKRIAPLFEPMQRTAMAGSATAMAALSTYHDDELALLLDFLGRARVASLAAMAELRALGLPQPKPKPNPKPSGTYAARRSARR